MMRPTVWIWLSSNVNARRLLFVIQPKGDGNIYFRTLFRLADRKKRDESEVVSVCKRNLSFLHFDGYIPNSCQYSIL